MERMMLLFSVVVAGGTVDVAGGCGKIGDTDVDDVVGSWLLKTERRVGALLMGCSRSTLQGVPEEACSGPRVMVSTWRSLRCRRCGCRCCGYSWYGSWWQFGLSGQCCHLGPQGSHFSVRVCHLWSQRVCSLRPLATHCSPLGFPLGGLR